MTTTVERFHVDSDDAPPVYFEENPDLTVHLLLGGLHDAQYVKRGIVLVYLGVDDYHAEVSTDASRSISRTEILTEAIERLTTVRDELRRLA